MPEALADVNRELDPEKQRCFSSSNTQKHHCFWLRRSRNAPSMSASRLAFRSRVGVDLGVRLMLH
jgi:hypothetical protein